MRKLLFVFAVLLLLAVIAAPSAMAAGTLAGTVISNKAYADYKDANANAMPRVYSNTVTTTVSQVAGVSVLPPTIAKTAKNGDVIYYQVQLFNTGNGSDTQTFTYATAGDWTPTSVRMFSDVNKDGAYDAGDILLTQIGVNTYQTSAIAPDNYYAVIMEVTVPAGAPAGDNTSSVVTINTKSDLDNTKTDTGTYTTTATAAVLSAVKTHTPAGALKPGDIITYTITLTNSGTLPSSNVVLTDPLSTNLTYLPGSLKVNINGAGFVAKTDAADNDGIKYTAGAPSIINAPDGATTITIAAGATWAMQFQATVNAGVASGTLVLNQATVNYSTGTGTPTVQTNGDTFLVSTLAAIDLASTTAPKAGDPGSQIVYPFTVTNNGNLNDKVDLTVTSTQGWTWAIWVDVDGNGIPGTGGDYLLTDTNTNGKIDTNTLALNGGTINLLAVSTIPAGSANGTVDTITITGASANDPTKTDTQIFTTTVKAPVLSVVKGVTAIQAPGGGAVCTPTNTTNGSPCKVVPGSVLTYTVTITNSGTGNATNIVITDIVPQYTTYKADSIKTGSSIASLTARNDAVNGDGGAFNSGTNSVVVPDGGTLTVGASGTWVLQFQVTVN